MDDLIELRHYLHQHPEVSQNENETQKHLCKLLENLNPDNLIKLAQTGLLVIFKGKTTGKNILLRADIDALPIQETVDLPYSSGTKGVSHKCGHDGHTTIMYGVASHFATHRPEKGNAYLLFQPAEENGWGARAVIESGQLENLDISYVFALHNLPGLPLKQVLCKEGSFSSSVVTIVAYFKGYTAHAAEPWNGRNPAKAMSKYTLQSLELNEEKDGGKVYTTISAAYTILGEKAYGISAGEGSVHLTVRADTNERLENALKKMRQFATAFSQEEDLELSFEYVEPFEANQNNPQAVAIIETSARHLNFDYKTAEKSHRWGEDFGLFTQIYPGAMFGIGSGENCKPLHHPAYDFPDDIIETAVNMFIQIQKTTQTL